VKHIQPALSLVAACLLLILPATLAARSPDITIPAGTVVNVRMIDSISSYQNYAGETFRGSLDNAVHVGNQVVLPRGATALVKLVEAKSAGRVKGRSELRLQLVSIETGHQNYGVASNVVGFRGKSETKKSAKNAGIGAAVGGGLGALFGGGKGAAIGAGLGAGAGVATNAAKKGEQVRIGSESLVRFQLSAPLRIRE
jgi:hypothetical protein